MKKVEQLNGLIEDFGFKSFIYEPGNEFITDQSSCITTIKYLDGESKEINHYYGHVSVSYTHLDVYKRQILFCRCNSISYSLCWNV